MHRRVVAQIVPVLVQSSPVAVAGAIGAGEDEVMTISFPDFGIRFETDLYVFFNQATHVEVLYA